MSHYYKALIDCYDPSTGHNLVKHELLTKRERYFYFAGLTDSNFKEVTISRSRTFNSFGCRFIIDDPERMK